EPCGRPILSPRQGERWLGEAETERGSNLICDCSGPPRPQDRNFARGRPFQSRTNHRDLDMALRDLTDIDLEQRIATLSKELATLKRTMTRRGGGYVEEGRDMAMDAYSDIAERVSNSLPYVRKRARMVEATARDHPAAAAAVGL